MIKSEHRDFAEYFKGMAQVNLAGVLETEKSIIRHVPYICLAMIVISLIFIDRVGPARDQLSLWCSLYSCWLLCFVSLVMIVCLLYQSAVYKDTINQSYIEYSLDGNIEILLTKWQAASQKWGAYGLALGSIITLLAALASLLIFIGVNIYP